MRQKLFVLLAILGLAGGVFAQEATPEPPVEEPTIQPFLGITYDLTIDAVIVADVEPDSPAERAGLQANDVLLAVDETDVTTENFLTTIQQYAPGDTATLTVERDGETLEAVVTFSERERRQERRQNRAQRGMMERPFIGVSIEDTPDGVSIMQVQADTPADEADLQAGDLIIEFDGQPVTDAPELIDTVAEYSPGDTVEIVIERDGETQTVTLELAARPMPAMRDGGIVEIPFGIGVDVTFDSAEETYTIEALPSASPLARAGLQAGDVVTAINGESREPVELLELVLPRGDEPIEDMLTLTVERGDDTLEVDAPRGAVASLIGQALFPMRDDPRGIFPPDGSPRGPDGLGPREGLPAEVQLGVLFTMLDETNAAQYGVEATEGAYLLSVEPNSPAANAGLQAGDIVLTVDGDVLDQERTLADRIRAYERGDTIILEVLRGGETFELPVTFSAPPQRGDENTSQNA